MGCRTRSSTSRMGWAITNSPPRRRRSCSIRRAASIHRTCSASRSASRSSSSTAIRRSTTSMRFRRPMPSSTSARPTKGMKTTRMFDKPEVMVPFRCDVHGWMAAYGGVVAHPYFAVSKADGTFAIKRTAGGHLHHRGLARAARHADDEGDGGRQERRDGECRVQGITSSEATHASPLRTSISSNRQSPAATNAAQYTGSVLCFFARRSLQHGDARRVHGVGCAESAAKARLVQRTHPRTRGLVVHRPEAHDHRADARHLKRAA